MSVSYTHLPAKQDETTTPAKQDETTTAKQDETTTAKQEMCIRDSPERDYNFCSIAAEYYSQGNGNFRDVSQNRRNDVFFNKDVGEFNVKTFFSLIQADGYNPLEVRPSLFNIKEGKEDEVKAYVADSISGDATAIQNIVAGKFTPGQISNTIAKLQLELKVDDGDFIANILNDCDQNIEAGFAEGYWLSLIHIWHGFLLR